MPYEITKLELKRMLKVLAHLKGYSPSVNNIEDVFNNVPNIPSMTILLNEEECEIANTIIYYELCLGTSSEASKNQI